MDELLLFNTNPIDRFTDRFGTKHGHLEMAYHAALPLALTPDLLYLIWANFRLDAQDKPLNMQWVTVADLILSPLCREIRHETYVMETAVRRELLNRMVKDERFGPQYILRLGAFIQHYADQYLASDIPSLQQYAQAQKWQAQAYTEPDRLIDSLANEFRRSPSDAETVRLADLMQTFSEPLNLDWVPTTVETAVNYDRLHAFGDSLAKFVRGDTQTATRQLRRLLGPARELNIGTMAIPVPTQVSQALADQEEKTYTYRVTVQDETAVAVEHIDHAGNTTNSLIGQLQLPDDSEGENLPTSQEIDHRYLRRVIVSAFSDNEVVDIIFELGLDMEDFAYAGKAVRIASLIRYMQRRNRLDELLKLCMEAKPEADWAQVLEETEAPITTSFNTLLSRAEENLATAKELRHLGQQLFNILFDETLRIDFLTFYEQAVKENAFLRLELDIDNGFIQDVALLPWELLCLPDNTGFGTDWLAAAPEVFMTRWRHPFRTNSTPRLLPTEKPLLIALVVGPHGYGESPLIYEPIWNAYLNLTSRYPGQFEVLPLLVEPTESILNNLLRQQPHIVHFLTHAQQFSLKGRDEGQIALLENEDNYGPEWINGDQFVQFFADYQPALILLQSNIFARPEMLYGLQDVAAFVAELEITTVLSWQFPVEDAAVAKFIHTVFPALAQGVPLDEAVQNGRRALLSDENPLAFAAPSLFANAIVRRRTAGESAPPTLPVSLGVAFAGDAVAPVLQKGTPLPATSEPIILRHQDNKLAQGFGYQALQIFQGESTSAHENYQLGDITLTDESLYINDELEIEVTLTVSPDHSVHIQLFHQSGFSRELTMFLVDPESLGEPSIIELEPLVDRFTQGVTESSHLAVLTAVSNWLNITDSKRTCIITGERGSGKTTIAALLAQYFRGDRQPPNDLYALAPTSTSAVYFCQPSRPETLDPRSFALTIANQWASRDSHFAYLQSTIENHEEYELDELVEQLLIRPFTDIDELIYPGSIIFLVDDLEAALKHPGETTIVDVILRMLREVYGVRFLLTAQMQTAVRTKLADVEAKLISLDNISEESSDELGPVTNFSYDSDSGGGEGGRTHGFRFMGKKEFKIDSTLSESMIAQARNWALGALRTVAWGDDKEYGSGKTYQFGRLPDRKKLQADLVSLARFGYRAYDSMITKLAGGVKNAYDLTDWMVTPGQVQIAVREGSHNIIPANLFYDYPFLDGNVPGDYSICREFLKTLDDDKPLEECSCFQGSCPSYNEELVICPSGFWGFRHYLGLPISVNDSPPPLRISDNSLPKMAVSVSTFPGLRERARHEQRLKQMGIGWEYADSRDACLELLKMTESQVVYFYGFGGVTDQGVPYIQLGQQGGDWLTRNHLRTRRIYWEKVRPLVFINCSTGDRPERFLDLVTGFIEQSGASGVICAEITLFEPLAVSFAEECLRRFLLEGQTIGEAMRGARLHLLKNGNPLGLIYTLYGLPALKI